MPDHQRCRPIALQSLTERVGDTPNPLPNRCDFRLASAGGATGKYFSVAITAAAVIWYVMTGTLPPGTDVAASGLTASR